MAVSGNTIRFRIPGTAPHDIHSRLRPFYYLPIIPGSTKVAARGGDQRLDGRATRQNVANVKFDFGSPSNASSFNNGWQGYAEIILEGTNSLPPTAPHSPYLTQDTLPTYAETVVGRPGCLHGSLQQFPANQLAMAAGYRRSSSDK